MKKIYLFLGAAIIASSSFAQTVVPQKAYISKTQTFSKNSSKQNENAKTPTDTIGLSPDNNEWVPGEFAKGGTVVNYTTVSGGYVYGVNGDDLNKCAQGWFNVNKIPVGIEGVLVYATAKRQGVGGSGTADATLSVYNMADNSANELDANDAWQLTSIGPTGSPLGSTTINYADLDTAGISFTYAEFPNVVPVNGDFAISFDASAIAAANDTVGLFCDADQEGFKLAFHFNPSGDVFISHDVYSLNLDHNIGILAIIDKNFVGIESHDFFNGMQVSAFPNPAINNATIAYNLNENKERVTLTVFDMSGKKVYSEAFGNQAKGNYKVNLDITNFNAGNYFYSLTSDGNQLTKKLVIVK